MGLALIRNATAMLDHARQRASGERIAAHGFGRAWDAGLGMLGDATAQTATRRRSKELRSDGVAQQSRGATIVKEPGQEGQEMAITDKLRAEVHRMNDGWCCITDKCFDELCDRIDAEHERECNEQYVCGAEHGIGANIDALMIQERGYIELPKDADGEYIHIGDKVTEHEDGHTFKVDGFMDWDGEWWIFMRNGIQAPASRCTHYHAPTVEDVLRDYASRILMANCIDDEDKLVDEYAAKLRLAESEKS